MKVFYAWLAIWVFMRRVVFTIGRSEQCTLRAGIVRRAAVGLAMLVVLWLEGWAFAYLFISRSRQALAPADGGAASFAQAVAWLTALLPLAATAVIVLSLHLLRWHLLARQRNG